MERCILKTPYMKIIAFGDKSELDKVNEYILFIQDQHSDFILADFVTRLCCYNCTYRASGSTLFGIITSWEVNRILNRHNKFER